MKKFLLARIVQNQHGTFGVLIDNLTPFCLTLERRWLNNKVGESCIPPDTYVCKRVKSPKFGDTFEVTNVKGRTSILFHIGNLMDDTHGCIVLGERYDPLGSNEAVLSSGDAFKEFSNRLKGINEFELTIVDVEVVNE